MGRPSTKRKQVGYRRGCLEDSGEAVAGRLRTRVPEVIPLSRSKAYAVPGGGAGGAVRGGPLVPRGGAASAPGVRGRDRGGRFGRGSAGRGREQAAGVGSRGSCPATFRGCLGARRERPNKYRG